jgi:alkaline phosphatase D
MGVNDLSPLAHGDLFAARRRLLIKAAGGSVLMALASSTYAKAIWTNPKFSTNPFTLGVASGDPSPDGFVIWTKIAPSPLELGAGLPRRSFEVDWEIARDESMREVVRKGKAVARPELGHAVHAEIDGLDPSREYFYRFNVGGEQSRIGRVKTLPHLGTPMSELRFAAAGCQKYEDGYFTAWRYLAAERLDFVFHYGDYIYEYNTAPGSRPLAVIRTLPGVSEESYSLDDYRLRYAAYKLDPDLQAAHASTAFIMSFDDHEVDNNFAADVSEANTPRDVFLLRRANAFQAWYENMPLRRAQIPQGPNIQAYRRLTIGNLLSMSVLDTRQYRSDQPCGDGARVNCAAALERHRTMLGDAQERWLYDGFRNTPARWTLLAQQVPIVRRYVDAKPGTYATHMDKWDGAVAARDRLVAAIEGAKLGNLVVATGDIHHNCIAELKKDFADEKSPTLGVEFVSTSISSLGDGTDTTPRFQALLRQDPHIKFYNAQRGYIRHVVTPDRWRADLQVLDKVTTPDGRMSTRQSFVVENGRPGLSFA